MNNNFQFGKQKQEQLLAQFSKSVTPSQLKEQIIEKGFDVYTKQDISRFITDAKEKNVLEKAISQVNELVPVTVKINAEQSSTVFVSKTPSAIEKAFDQDLNELSLDIIKGGARVPVGTVVVRKNGVKEMKTETGWKYMGKDKKGKSEEGDGKEKTEKPEEKTEGKSKQETQSGDKELDSMRKFAAESTDEKLEEVVANSKNDKAVQVAKKELESRKEKNKFTPAEQSFLNQLQTVDSSIKNFDGITVQGTPKGNYEVFKNGKKITNVSGSLLSEDMIDKNDMRHFEEEEEENVGERKTKNKKQPRVLSKLEPFLKEEGDRELKYTNWHIGGVVGTISSIFDDYSKPLVDFKEEAIKFFEKKDRSARRNVNDYLNSGAVAHVSPNDFVELYSIFQNYKEEMPEAWQNRFENKFRKGFNSMLKDAEKGTLTSKPKEDKNKTKESKKALTDTQVINRLSEWMKDMDEDDMLDVYTGVVPQNKVRAAADGGYELTPEEDKKLINKYRKIFSED